MSGTVVAVVSVVVRVGVWLGRGLSRIDVPCIRGDVRGESYSLASILTGNDILGADLARLAFIVHFLAIHKCGDL